MKPRRNKPKAKKPKAWSHKATPRCSVAIRELLEVRKQAAILRKKSKLLTEMVIAEGGGAAYGVRAAVRYRTVCTARGYEWPPYITFLQGE